MKNLLASCVEKHERNWGHFIKCETTIIDYSAISLTKLGVKYPSLLMVTLDKYSQEWKHNEILLFYCWKYHFGTFIEPLFLLLSFHLKNFIQCNCWLLSNWSVQGSIKTQKTRVSFHTRTCNMLQMWGWNIHLFVIRSITCTAKTQISGVLVHPQACTNLKFGVFHPTFGVNATPGWKTLQYVNKPTCVNSMPYTSLHHF